MADVTGLVLGAVSVAALFTTCIQCFDIVVAGKNFTEDYEQLYGLAYSLILIFAVLLATSPIWSLGESVGLVPSPEERRLRYDTNIDREDIWPGVERILNNIKSLLQDIDQVDQRYGLKSSPGKHSDVSTSVGIKIFKNSFERFKNRIKHNQKQKSTWTVTRWAIHDAAKFEVMINRLEKYVGGPKSSLTRWDDCNKDSRKRLTTFQMSRA